MKHTLRAFAGPMLVALALAGCADQTAPNKLLRHDPARPNYLPVDFNIPGIVTLCRVGPATSDVASIDYTLAATPDNGTSYFTLPSGNNFSLGASPACDTVEVSTQPYPNSELDYGTNVMITQALPAGVTIDSIVTTEEGWPDLKFTGTDNATVWTNYWHSAEITFYNAYTPPPAGCTLTIGFWKNHAGTKKQADVLSQYLPIWLGTAAGAQSLQITTAAEAVMALSMKYGNPSNGITKLYAQLLAAKLNGASGASMTSIASTIAAADAFLATHGYADWTSLSSSDKSMVLGWMTMLDDYNNGRLSPGHCD